VDVPVLVLCFAVLLAAGVLLSELANRTVLSTAVLFLAGGVVLGPGVLDVLHIESGDPGVTVLAELALFSVLYSDGMKVGLGDLRRAWRLPGRALLFGLPLTLLLTAAAAHWVVGLPWLESALLGAVLAPTDPVFAAAIVGRNEVPGRLRHLLNVESGVNDGLALPIVLVLLSAAGGMEAGGWVLAEELALGVVIGVAVPWLVLSLERLPFLKAVKSHEPLLPAAIGLLVLGLCLTTHANLFLAAFSAGITVATVAPEFKHEFEQLGELIAEQLKLVAILVFGALLTPAFLFAEIPWTGWLFAVLALLVARPVALLVAFLGSRLSMREQVAAMWFGPKGFASVVYGLLVLESGIGRADQLFHLVGLTIGLSIVAHSSTDVVVARQFHEPADAGDEAPARPVEEAGSG
jgi:NhaP-type Na+/H+ or K+/H+ antiporter